MPRRALVLALATALAAAALGLPAAPTADARVLPETLKATALSPTDIARSASSVPVTAEDWDLTEAFGDPGQMVTAVSAQEMRARAEAAAKAERDRLAAERREQERTGWVDPLQGKGRFTSGFGPRTLYGSPNVHEGVDLAAPVGTPIVAAFDGVVVYTGLGGGGWGLTGWIVAIEHETADGPLLTTYNHMFADGVLVKTGQEVDAGEQIARVGNEGNSTGPHLHFSTRVPTTGGGWKVVDPVPFLAERDVNLRDR